MILDPILPTESQPLPRAPLRILALTLGTRGDVEPLVALGQTLIARGHQYTLCTSASFRHYIEDAGIAYAHMDDGFMALLDSADGRAALERTRNLLESVGQYLKLARRVGPLQRQVFDDTVAALNATQPDLLLAMVKTHWAIDLAEAQRLPLAWVAFQPILVPTATAPTLLFPDIALGARYNRLTYRFLTWVIRALDGAHVRAWRRARGLTRKPKLLARLDGRAVPVLHAYSAAVCPRPDDWPSSAQSTGYWFLPPDPAWRPSTHLKDFLAAGPPPLYLGFGSMAGRNPARLGRIVLDALAQTGLRAIVARGRGGVEVDVAPASVCVIDDAPHGWLFERVSAVIHHGGAGTTAAGLRAGKPTLIVPYFGDQPFWGRRVQQLGLGPAPIPLARLTASRLANALTDLTANPNYRQAAVALGARVRSEDGRARAAEHIEALAQAFSALARP